MTASEHLSSPAHPLWVFIDESGNFDFSEQGTRYFLMTAVATHEPIVSAANMLGLKYEQMLRGSNQLDFHAVHNSRGTRLRAFTRIAAMSGLHVHTVSVAKQRLAAEVQNSVDLIVAISSQLIDWINNAISGFDAIVVVFDTALPARTEAPIKQSLKARLQKLEVPYRIHFHRVANEPNGQIAEYVAWAEFRSLERGDTTYLDLLETLGASRNEFSES